MLFLRKPTESAVIRYLLRQRDQPLSYPNVGATGRTPPPGYEVDHCRFLLGHGADAFLAARDSLLHWRMFPAEMVEVCFQDRPIKPGTVVAALFRSGPLWSLNPCRIVYTVDDVDEHRVRRFGFAYGTLPDHLARGEERFLVEWHPDDDSVWYDLMAFSRTQHLLAKCGYPIVRRVQQRFRRLSGEAMQNAVARIATDATLVAGQLRLRNTASMA